MRKAKARLTSFTIVLIAAGAVLGALGEARALAAPPANDSFATPIVLVGKSDAITMTNKDATKEAVEPNHAGNAGGASVWYRWTAPATGKVFLATFDVNFDTLLAVYTGSSLDALTEVASNDDSGASDASSVTFWGVAGTVYEIAVDGYNGSLGVGKLGWAQGPSNDDFGSAETMSGESGRVLGSNEFATRENGEQDHAGVRVGASIWYRWTASSSTWMRFDTVGSVHPPGYDHSKFDTVFAVYTGNAVGALQTVASNDDFAGNLTSGVSFRALAGTVYYVAVDGFTFGDFPEMGNVVLNWFPGRIITGSRRNEMLVGTAGADYIDGRAGNDRIRGLAGRDVLIGGSGSDRLAGNAGADSLSTRDGVRGNDVAAGGPGRDRCQIDRRDLAISC